MEQNGMQDVMYLVLQRLDWVDVLTFRSVCKMFKHLADDLHTDVFPPRSLALSLHFGDEISCIPERTPFFRNHILPRLRLKLDYYSDDSLWEKICRVQRVLHLRIRLYHWDHHYDAMLHRVEFLCLVDYTVTASDMMVLQSVPHIEFSCCKFEPMDLTNLSFSTFLMTSNCKLADPSSLLPFRPVPCFNVDLSLVRMAPRPGDAMQGDWRFRMSQTLTPENKHFIQRVTGKLFLTEFSRFWSERNRLETLSCSELCLEGSYAERFPLIPYPSLHTLRASDFFLQYPAPLPMLRAMHLSDCWLDNYDFATFFPKLETLEIHYLMTDPVTDKPDPRIVGLQCLRRLVLNLRPFSTNVVVKNNPNLDSLTAYIRVSLTLTNNPLLREIYLEKSSADDGVNVSVLPLDTCIHVVKFSKYGANFWRSQLQPFPCPNEVDFRNWPIEFF